MIIIFIISLLFFLNSFTFYIREEHVLLTVSLIMFFIISYFLYFLINDLLLERRIEIVNKILVKIIYNKTMKEDFIRVIHNTENLLINEIFYINVMMIDEQIDDDNENVELKERTNINNKLNNYLHTLSEDNNNILENEKRII